MPAGAVDAPPVLTPASVAAALGTLGPDKLAAPLTIKDKYELLPAFLQVRRMGEVGGREREGANEDTRG